MPYTGSSVNRFSNLLTRLDSIYTIQYAPPMRPHEPQFTLICRRRIKYMTVPRIGMPGRFHAPDKIPRSANYVLRYLDNKRLYYGIINRKLVYDGLYTRSVMHAVRDYLAVVFENLESVRKGGKCPEPPDFMFSDNPKFYADEVVELASQTIVRFLSLESKGTKKRAKRANRINDDDDFDEFLTNFSRGLFNTTGEDAMFTPVF